MYENNVNPYSGDLYHENPLILYASNFLIRKAAPFIPYLFVACDLLCAFLLFRMAKDLTAQMVCSTFLCKIPYFVVIFLDYSLICAFLSSANLKCNSSVHNNVVFNIMPKVLSSYISSTVISWTFPYT